MKRVLTIVAAALIALLIFTQQSHAGSVNKEVIFSGTGITADVNGDWYCFDNRAVDFVFESVATFNSGTSTLDTSIVTTTDKSHISDAIVSFTQVTTSSASEYKTLGATTHVLRCVRAVVDVGAAGSPNYDLVVTAHYRLD